MLQSFWLGCDWGRFALSQTQMLAQSRGEIENPLEAGYCQRKPVDHVSVILSSFLRVTMAFFQCGARPSKGVRLRRALPRTLRVLTLMTLTLKSSCTAWRISLLLARRSATTVY